MQGIQDIFKVIVAGDASGTAFIVQVTNSASDVYYLLTAYHVISEAICNKETIYVEDEDGDRLESSVVFPLSLQRQYREFGLDFAVLKIKTEKIYHTFRVAYDVYNPCNCYVRGSVPHYKTNFSTFKGDFFGNEKIGDNPVIAIELLTDNLCDSEGKNIPEQTVLKGLSGAPVLIEDQKEYFCVGILGNFESDSAASRKYGVPIRTVMNKYSIPNGIEFAEKPTIVVYENPVMDLGDTIIKLLIDDPEEFLLSDENMDMHAWNKLSNLFYQGQRVDKNIKQIIDAGGLDFYTAEIQCALMYYYARLLLKRENKSEAFRVFDDILSKKRRLSENSQLKMQALIDTRRAIEGAIRIPKESIANIRFSGEKITKLHSTENYIANELASVLGRGLANFFAIDVDFSGAEKSELITLFEEHKSLVYRYPDELCKQEVVSTILQWYTCLWCINTDLNTNDLKLSIQSGFSQSKKRKNAIFYIQCTMACAIFLAMSNKKRSAVSMLLLSVKLIKKENLNLSHEGIAHLLLFLRKKYPELYAVAMYMFSADNEYDFENKIYKYNTELNISSWFRVFDNVRNIYDEKFGRTSKVYDVVIDDILRSL